MTYLLMSACSIKHTGYPARLVLKREAAAASCSGLLLWQATIKQYETFGKYAKSGDVSRTSRSIIAPPHQAGIPFCCSLSIAAGMSALYLECCRWRQTPGKQFPSHIDTMSLRSDLISGFITNRCLGWRDTDGHCAHQSPAAVQGILGALILGKLHKSNACGAVVVKKQAALCDMSCT